MNPISKPLKFSCLHPLYALLLILAACGSNDNLSPLEPTPTPGFRDPLILQDHGQIGLTAISTRGWLLAVITSGEPVPQKLLLLKPGYTKPLIEELPLPNGRIEALNWEGDTPVAAVRLDSSDDIYFGQLIQNAWRLSGPALKPPANFDFDGYTQVALFQQEREWHIFGSPYHSVYVSVDCDDPNDLDDCYTYFEGFDQRLISSTCFNEQCQTQKEWRLPGATNIIGGFSWNVIPNPEQRYSIIYNLSQEYNVILERNIINGTTKELTRDDLVQGGTSVLKGQKLYWINSGWDLDGPTHTRLHFYTRDLGAGWKSSSAVLEKVTGDFSVCVAGDSIEVVYNSSDRFYRVSLKDDRWGESTLIPEMKESEIWLPRPYVLTLCESDMLHIFWNDEKGVLYTQVPLP